MLKGFEAALERKRRSPVPKLLEGEGEARLIARCLGSPPAGRADWSLRVLAERAVELEIVESSSRRSW